MDSLLFYCEDAPLSEQSRASQKRAMLVRIPHSGIFAVGEYPASPS